MAAGAILSAIVMAIGIVGYAGLLLYAWCLRYDGQHDIRNPTKTRDVILQELVDMGEESRFSTDSETDHESSSSTSTDLGTSEDW